MCVLIVFKNILLFTERLLKLQSKTHFENEKLRTNVACTFQNAKVSERYGMKRILEAWANLEGRYISAEECLKIGIHNIIKPIILGISHYVYEEKIQGEEDNGLIINELEISLDDESNIYVIIMPI